MSLYSDYKFKLRSAIVYVNKIKIICIKSAKLTEVTIWYSFRQERRKGFI
ncbi:protein of unknown function [Tenacibaculum sp. 190524A02b]|uniref:Uncharacterized protein n=1 Tax=Tenacibaculum vairaonense TaxID=3137860 RepID=A0ABP1FFS0_9FLAO